MSRFNKKRFTFVTGKGFLNNLGFNQILDDITTNRNGVTKYKFVTTVADEIRNSIPPDDEDLVFPVVEVPEPSVNLLWRQTEVGDVVTKSTTTRQHTHTNRRRFRSDINFGIDTTTTTSSQTTTTTDVTASTVSTLIPYMRGKRVYFSASAVKPNAKLHAFFDGFDVTNLCRLTNGQNYGELKVSENGRISGYFDLPHGRFKAGIREFTIRDVVDPTKEVVTTTATAKYRSQGVRNDTTITYNISSVTNVQTNVHTQNVSWKDPLAQSFTTDNSGTPNGFFLSSIDLFFNVIESGDIVTVELRNVTNGYPNSNIYNEYTTVSLGSDDIKTSADGSVPTNFKFGTPVFLPKDGEYCFVVYSNSEKTELYISELGKRNYRKGDTFNATGEIIAKQPYLGSMFISQNRTTWTAEQTKDIKFNIYRCEFERNGVVKFANANKETGTTRHIKLLGKNPLVFKDGSNSVYVECLGHGMKEQDNFILAFGGDVPDTLFGIPKSQVQGTRLQVTSIDFRGFSFQLNSNAVGSGNAGGNHCAMLGYNHAFSVFDLRMRYTAVDGTLLTNKFAGRQINKYTDNSSANVADTDVINDSTNVLGDTYVIKNDGDGGIQIVSLLSTTETSLSPIIESNSVAVKLHRNLIDSESNKSPSMYIQKNVELSKPANQLKVFFDYNLQIGCGIVVEVLFNKNKDDYYNAKDSEWVVINPTTPLITHINDTEYKTATYQIDNAGFNSFAVRIKFTSLNNAIVPSIANYRAIALLTTN